MILKKIRILILAILKTKLSITIFLLILSFYTGKYSWFNFQPDSYISFQKSAFLYYFMNTVIGCAIWFLFAIALGIAWYTYEEIKENYGKYSNLNKL